MSPDKRYTAADKKKITADWNRLFPSLGVYERMHLMNRAGPLLVCILLHVKRGNDHYYPTFHVHNLTAERGAIGLFSKIELRQVRYGMHDKVYEERAEKLRKEALIPFEGDLDLSTVINGYKTYLEQDYPQMRRFTCEDIVLLNGWCGNEIEVQRGLDYAEYRLKDWWPKTRLIEEIGTLEEWLSDLEKRALNQEELQKTCEQQIAELKVDKLPVRNFYCNR